MDFPDKKTELINIIRGSNIGRLNPDIASFVDGYLTVFQSKIESAVIQCGDDLIREISSKFGPVVAAMISGMFGGPNRIMCIAIMMIVAKYTNR